MSIPFTFLNRFFFLLSMVICFEGMDIYCMSHFQFFMYSSYKWDLSISALCYLLSLCTSVSLLFLLPENVYIIADLISRMYDYKYQIGLSWFLKLLFIVYFLYRRLLFFVDLVTIIFLIWIIRFHNIFFTCKKTFLNVIVEVKGTKWMNWKMKSYLKDQHCFKPWRKY